MHVHTKKDECILDKFVYQSIAAAGVTTPVC